MLLGPSPHEAAKGVVPCRPGCLHKVRFYRGGYEQGFIEKKEFADGHEGGTLVNCSHPP